MSDTANPTEPADHNASVGDNLGENGGGEKNDKKLVSVDSKKRDDELTEEGGPPNQGAENNSKAPQHAGAPKRGNLSDLSETTTNPKRPVKKARTAYFIFADERRDQVKKDHPGESVASIGRALGQIWHSLTEDEKQVYQKQAAEERQRVCKEMEAWTKLHDGGGPDCSSSLAVVDESVKKSTAPLDPFALGYPSARIRKICKLDPEVKGLSKEALMLVTKAAELATIKLGQETVRVAQIQNRRKLLPEDVAMVCRTRERFEFLKQDVLDLVREQQQLHNHPKETDSKSRKQQNAPPTTSNPITSYFTSKQNK